MPIATPAEQASPARESPLYPARWPVLKQIFWLWRRFRRWFSRREWTVRLLGLDVSEGTADEPGLLLLQIDGLARVHLERALAKGHMPFLKRLMRREGYQTETFYPGQPATTPAVLGELYYGVPQAVPAFGFRDHRTGQVVEMFQPAPACTIQDELSQRGEGLLEGGSAYCTIYTGGARESTFCPGGIRRTAFRDAAAWKKAAIFLFNFASLLRILALVVAEFFVACWDVLTGKFLQREFKSEMALIPRRVIGAIFAREIAVIGAEVDAVRGLPIIHVNFLGYDEEAHRRGPASKLALWSLRGIDAALQRLWNAAHASRRRDYHVWFMSDHGQERTIPYENEFGRTIQDAIRELFADDPSLGEARTTEPASESPAEPSVVAIGPLGSIYWPRRLSPEEIERIAPRVVSEAHVPLVLAKLDGQAVAWTKEGRFAFPDEADNVFAADHPHREEVAADLAKICSHPDAGDLVISGWRNHGLPYSYVCEHGAHAGPGPQETSGFLLLPPDAPPRAEREKTRPVVLRRMVRQLLRREPYLRVPPSAARPPGTLRLVTYNVHSCIGLDGRLSIARIARILARLNPDVIALQELDVRRRRTGGIDQADAIARMLEMQLQFHASFDVEDERFGNAVLSRLPMTFLRAGALPREGTRSEPRGALWVEIDVGSQPLQLVTTHLGTGSRERELQVESLLGPEWMGRSGVGPHAVLCGDFNAVPSSRAYRKMAAALQDAQRAPGIRARRTWFGPLPLTRIDHVFVGEGVRVLNADVPRMQLAQIGSDHLPLVVDLELMPAEANRSEELVGHSTA